jgi:rhodanese-related sulfurtransferase
MAKSIDRVGVQDLAKSGFQLIDVLPPKQYRESHLPGAVNIPLSHLTAASTAELSEHRPTVVYCYDYQ